MLEVFTGWKLGVELADAGGPYIIVPEQQLPDLCCLLTEHRIPHAVDGAVPSRHHADSPFAMVVRLGLAIDVSHIQDILDLAP
jgi:hypothetical protein